MTGEGVQQGIGALGKILHEVLESGSDSRCKLNSFSK